MIEKKRGNLLEADAEALVNTVNTVGVMGKGIALQVKKAFPKCFKPYKKACDDGSFDVGQVIVHDNGGLHRPRYVVHLPTKKHWRSKSRLEWIDSGLEALVAEVRRLKIESIAVPPLGCGLGGLRWEDVLPRIEAAFAELPEVRVLVYEPAGAPSPAAMKNRTKRPAMTIGRAVVLGLMDRYVASMLGYRLSLLEAQKLVYFQVEAGETLRGLRFEKHHYGPYADTLRHVFERMDGHFLSGWGDGENKPETPIDLDRAAAEEAQHFLADDRHAESRERFDRVIDLIEGFESPHGMELLASVHWVATREAAEDQAPAAFEKVVRGVHAWSGRKQAEMPEEQIRVAWEALDERGWLKNPRTAALLG